MTRPPCLRASVFFSVSVATAVAFAGGTGCESKPLAPEVPAYLFDPRVPLDPELEKLKKGGDDPTQIVRPASAAELLKLDPAKRYLYVVLANGQLALSPKPMEAPGNFWSHPILANGAAVKAAGHLRIDKANDKLVKVVVDADSDTYCPTADTIRQAFAALLALHVPSDVLRADNHPADCYKPKALKAEPAGSIAPAPRPSFGTVMLSVARRFEVLGRAWKAKRNELALYQLEEIEETFKNEIPGTALPPLPPGVTVTPFLDTMMQFNVPALRKALEAKDAKAVLLEYESMSKTCNGCHQAAARAYVEVPTVPGELVPRLDPKP